MTTPSVISVRHGRLLRFLCLVGTAAIGMGLVGAIAVGAPRTGGQTNTTCGGAPLYSHFAHEGGEINSPDKKKILTIHATDSSLLYNVKANGLSLTTHARGFRAEALWSPDSNAFAVNQTEGGGGIEQRAYVISLGPRGLRKIDVSRPIEMAFGLPAQCEVSMRPNTAVVQWLGATHLLMIAEIPNVSLCKCRGTFRAYELSLRDLKVVASYTQAETKRRFRSALGCELREADEACAMSWQNP